MRTAGSQVERSSLCGAVACRALCSLKRFSLPEIYVSMNSPRYAFDINFPPLQIEFAGQADTGHTDRRTDVQRVRLTARQSGSQSVALPVSQLAVVVAIQLVIFIARQASFGHEAQSIPPRPDAALHSLSIYCALFFAHCCCFRCIFIRFSQAVAIRLKRM